MKINTLYHFASENYTFLHFLKAHSLEWYFIVKHSGISPEIILKNGAHSKEILSRFVGNINASLVVANLVPYITFLM